MKRQGLNIINSDDVSLVGTAEETLSDVVDLLQQLKSNVKWLYSHTKNVKVNVNEISDVHMSFISLEEYDNLILTNKIDPNMIYLIAEE